MWTFRKLRRETSERHYTPLADHARSREVFDIDEDHCTCDTDTAGCVVH